MTVHRDQFLTIKATRCTNYSNLFLEWNSTCFGQFPCPSSEVFHCTHSNSICHTGLLTACSQAVSCQQTCMTYHCFVYSKKTPDDGQRNCLKHVEFYKFEKLVHLVGFIIRNLKRCMVTWTSKSITMYPNILFEKNAFTEV